MIEFKKYLPTHSESWILILFTAIVGGLAVGLFAIIPVLIFPESEGVITMISYPLMFIPPYLYIRYKIKEQSQGFFNESGDFSFPINSNDRFGKLGMAGSLLLLIPLVILFNLVAEPLSSWMGVPEFLKQLFEQITDNKIAGFITVVIFAPLFEEFLCRGIILRGLLRYKSPISAIVLSALMFGIMHLNPWQAIPATLVGILMGWIYWKTGSLWLTIFIHFVNNGFSYFVTILFPNLPQDTTYADLIPQGYYTPVYIVSFLIVAAILYLMNKSYDKPISYKI